MSEKIIFKKDDENFFWHYWEQLVIESKASIRYFPETLKSWYLISQDKSLYFADFSFVYLVNDQIKAGVFLPLEKKGNDIFGTIMDDYIDAPIFLDQSVEKNVFLKINELAKENQVKKIMFLVDPLVFQSHYNYLQKYHYLDTSILSYVIDLTKDDLLAACRRGHKSDIKNILKNKDFNIFYIDKNNANYNIHEEYRLLHHKCSGRVTRPKQTFDLQFEKLKKGYAVLFGLNHQGKNVAFSYFDFFKEKAAYASAADDPDYNNLSLYHPLIFSAMEYLKKFGCRYLDVEPPCSPSAQYDYYPTQKELNIALFKRGFGGFFVQNFRGIKYFDQKIFEQDTSNFMKQYEPH
ncbi:MAG: hypothetical protein A2729_04085 [Candidatus Buchananbacteria bacterium RIFCSPHIGHO2_01_FULL_39_14]|uniref:BioF2-like acetyltransferase domain-containing protein n=1 Tax=Candidatus Buchananbacteria bacterium RIFCSPHIGHO2_01_FULL_39_14 TaxID=1797532 RepID=A0A1G1XXS9_9BACT|nr:MAG: hypothetical protein A2729_04085 [Candidatus Buchananbacteria bacterium RIFCSPHIGHO2_01_FULL_39_14]OGY48648.1 MAG: hypothetical protein A3D39_05280 [Candidatus Buchananbacteria bacterium RIFCSPHIGHO2_02_FULL_39_17]